jgi:ZIP family zinc transporter
VATTAAVASAIVVGGVLGVVAFGRLGGAGLYVVLSFGTVALLYLVTEELLTEAHEQPDTPLLTAMFFVGFLVLLLVSFAI